MNTNSLVIGGFFIFALFVMYCSLQPNPSQTIQNQDIVPTISPSRIPTAVPTSAVTIQPSPTLRPTMPQRPTFRIQGGEREDDF